jgi:hypothetical protein
MIEGTFDSRLLAKMNLALDRVCERTANGESHCVRSRVAEQIIKCASRGRTTLGELTDAGQRALISVATLSDQPEPSAWTGMDGFGSAVHTPAGHSRKTRRN